MEIAPHAWSDCRFSPRPPRQRLSLYPFAFMLALQSIAGTTVVATLGTKEMNHGRSGYARPECSLRQNGWRRICKDARYPPRGL
jgi:hypothetical protein